MIIGIAGKKNSGKDTIASMINYIKAVGITRAKYSEWIVKRIAYDEANKHKIIHFADNVKKCLSIIYGIPLKYFYDRDYKDNKYYCLTRGYFIKKDEQLPKNAIIIDNFINNSLAETYIKDYILQANKNHNDFTAPPIYITLRLLMQYFGTNICRKELGENIWIHSTMYDAKKINDAYDICIIPDVRFSNEANAILHSSLYGQVIRVHRNSDDNNDNSESEQIHLTSTYIVMNDGTLSNLFYKVLEIMQQIINNQNK